MLKIRKFEEKALELFEANKLRGSVHLYIGQEAVASTVCSRLTDDDYITSTHRGHGHCIAKGAELKHALAELMGKLTGYCKGRGGSMHIADVTKGNLCANAIVGAGVPIATGAALSSKLRGNGRVAVTFFGDGASNQGVTLESFNLASVWKLPIIFICENNQFGISVSTKKSTSVKDIAVRAGGFNMPGHIVDGNDVFAVDEVFEKALEHAKAGKGPSLIEFKTYRWKGHWTGDPEVYRTKEEVDEWKKKCPIKRCKDNMIKEKIQTKKQLEEIESKVDKLIEEAEEFSMNSPEPDPANVMDEVFCCK
jgi:pyruvate dehydrogenase E1 component alpha subunit